MRVALRAVVVFVSSFEMRSTPTESFAFISDNAGNAIELIEHKTP